MKLHTEACTDLDDTMCQRKTSLAILFLELYALAMCGGALRPLCGNLLLAWIPRTYSLVRNKKNIKSLVKKSSLFGAVLLMKVLTLVMLNKLRCHTHF